MRKSSLMSASIVAAMFVLCSSTCGARAQAVYGTDYLSFEGVLVVLDNPTSTDCQADGVNYNDTYRVSYRFTNNPSVISDSLALFPSGDNAARMISTQSPGFSLVGSATTNWTYINHYGTESLTPTASSSQLTILSGLNQAVSLGTGNIKITGSINNFLAFSDCNISSVHAALVALPK